MPVVLPNLDAIEDDVRAALREEDHDRLGRLVLRVHPADVAEIIDRLDPKDRVAVFRVLSRDAKSEVLDEVSPEATRQLLTSLPADQVGPLLNRLPMDDAAEILSEDVPERRDELLSVMAPPDADDVRVLLAYPPNSAGRMMTEKFARVRPDMTAAETISALRGIGPEVDTITYLYAVDDDGRLQGVCSLREVVTGGPHRPLANLLRTEVVAVRPETDQEEMARTMSRYDFSALPVVRDDGVMLGVVTIDDVFDVLVRESGEDLLRMGGMDAEGLNQPYFSIPILRVVRKRVGWLLLLFVAGTLTGTVLRTFEDQLVEVVALSFFIPLLIGTGGNTGAQTVSTLIRGLALGEIRFKDTGRVLGRELLSGLILGLLLGTVAFGRALLWHSSARLSLVVGLAIVCIVTWANTVGALIPLVAHRLRIDPAMISAPLITTVVDATGLAIYLLIAIPVLGL
jgi:magnesium transporter